MKKNTISAHLILTSEKLDPDALSALTGVSPRWSGRRGDPIGGPGSQPRRHHFWEYSTAEEPEEIETRVIDTLVNELLDRFEPRSEHWRGQRESGEIVVVLVCEIWVEAEYSPALELQASTVRRVAALGARVWFDLYCGPVRREDEAPS